MFVTKKSHLIGVAHVSLPLTCLAVKNRYSKEVIFPKDCSPRENRQQHDNESVGEAYMPKRKEAIVYAKVGDKDLWHPYALQSLSSERFTKVVNRILQGRFEMLNMRNIYPMQG